MNLKAEGTRLTGVVRMGPGAREPVTPADFWEYFFDPVDFKIANGKVVGNQIDFEQVVVRPEGAPQGSGRGATRSSFESRFIYRGVLQGDQIVMTREVVPNNKDTLSLGNHRVEFMLQRVK
jgi:hypothetical protein